MIKIYIVSHEVSQRYKQRCQKAWLKLRSTPLPQTPILNYYYHTLFSQLTMTNFAYKSQQHLIQQIKTKEKLKEHQKFNQHHEPGNELTP